MKNISIFINIVLFLIVLAQNHDMEIINKQNERIYKDYLTEMSKSDCFKRWGDRWQESSAFWHAKYSSLLADKDNHHS